MGLTGFEKAKTVLRVTSGNFLEMYDFSLFGIYARQFAQTFFPSDDPYASLMATFLSFAAGFAMRPIGALVLGPFIDRIGRRKGLIVALSIMACGTIPIAFVLAYATIGVLAPTLVVLGRLLQEILGRRRARRRVGPSLGDRAARRQGVLCLLAVGEPAGGSRVRRLLGFAIDNLLAPELACAWGWRIPFFRRKLQETPEFAARKVHPATVQIFVTLGANWPIVLGGVAMAIMTTVSFYLITVYTPTFGRSVLNLTESEALLATIAVAASNLIWLPISGAMSDRIGRKPILVAFAILGLVTAYPALGGS